MKDNLPARFAQACVRLGADPDWNTVLEYLDAQYDDLKERLVGCPEAEQEVLKGKAQFARQLRTEIRAARSRLESLEASRQASRTSALP